MMRGPEFVPGEFTLKVRHGNGDITSVLARGIKMGVTGDGWVLVRFGSANDPGRTAVDVALSAEAVQALIGGLSQAAGTIAATGGGS